MKISFSIVTYNNENEICGILSSIEKCNSADIDVTVVDNNSSDNTVNKIRMFSSDIKIIQNRHNVGYGAANNQVIMIADSDYHIVANPDVSFSQEELYKMLDYMENNRDVSLLIPKVLHEDGTEQYLPKKYPALRYVIASRFERFGRVLSRLRDEYTLKSENVCEPIDVDYATGCFMLFRTDDLKAIKGFDTRYFLYSEDADITLEIQSQGRTVYVPSVHIIHKWKRETVKNRKAFLVQISSLIKFYIKWGIRI